MFDIILEVNFDTSKDIGQKTKSCFGSNAVEVNSLLA